MRSTGPGEFLLHPLGTLTIRQSVVPLGTRIDRFGRARPTGAAQFEIRGASVRGRAADTTVVREHFARSEFFDLNEEQAYGGPSFEAMPAGITVGSTVVTAGPSRAVPLEVRTFVYDAETDRMDAADTYTLPDGHLHAFLAIGAVARSRAAYAGPPQPVRVTVPGYVVAAVDTFAGQPTTQADSSYTAAGRALRAQVAANPHLKGTLTVASSEVAA
ncbi:MAG: hypothetical protein R2712_07035 [Vicinamibacterales bacterium]